MLMRKEDVQEFLIFGAPQGDVSKDLEAEKVVGKRDIPEYAIIIDSPCERDYHCPVCKYPLVVNGHYDERLEWSEYNGFIWCSVCNFDYLTPLCVPNLNTLEGQKRATEIFLLIIEDAKKDNHLTHDIK